MGIIQIKSKYVSKIYLFPQLRKQDGQLLQKALEELSIAMHWIKNVGFLG